jgi:hypothetical protein
MQASRSPRYSTAQLTFIGEFLDLVADPLRRFPFHLRIMCRHLDWQVSSAVQIFGTLSPVLSTVEYLTLNYMQDYMGHNRSAELHNDIDRTQWRELFRPFSNVKTLCVPNALSLGLSHSLRSEDGEMPLELLPNLQELQHLGGRGVNVFTIFINGRQAAGHPVRQVTSRACESYSTRSAFI